MVTMKNNIRNKNYQTQCQYSVLIWSHLANEGTNYEASYKDNVRFIREIIENIRRYFWYQPWKYR